jgi:hypothetical protein
LSEVKLVDIEHRKHDPYQVINRHVAQCGLKAYEHEDSFYDDIFRNVKSYDEVQSRVQTLSPDAQVGFASFQRNRRQCLPKILQGEVSTSEQEIETIPPGFETIIQYDTSDKGKLKDYEIPPEDTESSQNKEIQTKKGKEAETNPIHLDDIPEKVGGTTSRELGSPITVLTPLQPTFGNPHEGALYMSDLEPISRDEIPSSDYFFNKKRKAALKQELHPVGDRTVKKHKIIIDGKKIKETEFATELVGTLGAVASTNMYSIGNLITMMEQKDQEITQLQDRHKENEKLIEWGIQKGLEQARLKDIQEIQQLNENLTEAKHMIRTTQEQVQTLDNENKLLQDKIISIANQVIGTDQFKNKAAEIYANIQEEQQKVFCNLETIQSYFHEYKRSLDEVMLKEMEAKAVRNSFQKILTALQKEEIGKSPKLSILEQLKGDAMIKVWETNLEGYKKITKNVNEDCQKIFDSIEKESTLIGIDGFSNSLGEIDINRYQLKAKEELEEKTTEISNIKIVNMAEIEKLMIDSSSKLEKVKSTEKAIANQLPELQRSFFSFESNKIPEAPKALVNFLEKHVQATEADKESLSTQS